MPELAILRSRISNFNKSPFIIVPSLLHTEKMLHCHISASVAKSTPTPCKSRRGQQPLASVSHQPLLLHSSSSSCCHSTAALQPTSPTGWSQPISRSSSSSRKHTHRTAAAAPDTLVAEERSQQPTIDFLGVLNDMQTVRGVLETAADPDLVYSILVDYDSCSRVFRNISGSQTLFTDAGGKQVVQVSTRQSSTSVQLRG